MSSVLPSLNPTFGALLIGLLIATFLEGVLTLQVYIYFSHFKEDRLLLRSLVAFVWFLDTFHLAVVSSMQYQYVISNYDDPAFLLNATWSFDVAVILTTLIACAIQSYFTWRTWKFTKSITLTLALSLLAATAFGTGVACGVQTFILKAFDRFLKFRWLVGLWLGSSAACDVLVALSLCYALYSSKTGYKATDSILTRLILWTLNTGLLTSVVAILDVICFTTMNNLVHFAFNMILGKLYANMFVATLNQRLQTRSGQVSTKGLEFDSQAGGGISRIKTGLGMNVHITTTKETTTFPAADTPPTPLTPLGHLNQYRSNGRFENDHDLEMGVEEKKVDLVSEDAEFENRERKRSVLPHFTTVGEP